MSPGVVLHLAGGGGEGAGGGGSKGRGGGGGGGDGENEGEKSVEELMKEFKLDEAELPEDLRNALKEGRATSEALRRFVDLTKSWWLKPFMGISLFRQRLLADNTFMNKVVIEVALGSVMQFVAEKSQRKDKFVKEMDFVVAGVITAALCNFFAVCLSAPTLIPKAVQAGGGAIAQFLRSCPDNAFQTVLKGTTPPSLLQRCGGIVKPMPELFMVGFLAAAGGYVYTSLSVGMRKIFDPEMKGGAEVPPLQIAKIATAVGAYVAVSSNVRYQFMAGVLEQRMIDVALANFIAVRTACSTIIRTSNTYLGSYLLVAYIKLLNLQKLADEGSAGKQKKPSPKRK